VRYEGHLGITTAKHWNGEVVVFDDEVDLPARLEAPSRVFLQWAKGDIFHEQVPDGLLDKLFDVAESASQHLYVLITKRAERMATYLMRRAPRVRLSVGVSAENQAAADARIPWLQHIDAEKRFVSAKPLLGPLSVVRWPWLDLISVSSEAGPVHRPLDLSWAKELHDECQALGVEYWYKQCGGHRHEPQFLDGPGFHPLTEDACWTDGHWEKAS